MKASIVSHQPMKFPSSNWWWCRRWYFCHI